MAANYLKGEPLVLSWKSAWCEHEAKTIPQLFRAQVEQLGDSTLYHVKREGVYQPVAWRQVHQAVQSLAAGLIARGIQPGDRVAILAENSYNWVITDLAILHAGAISVTLHFPLTPAQVEEQLRDSESVAIFVSNATQAQKVEQVRERLPALKHFFSFEPLSGWVALGELQEEGRQLLRDKPRLVDETAESLNWDSLATIIYTSGTTGESKGVMLSHGNLLASVYAAMRVFPPPDRNYVMLNFLPLSHIYARTCDYLASMALGVELAFAESIDTLREDLQAIRPHAINGVPRFYEKVRERVLEVTQSKPLLRLLGKFARKKGLQRAFGGRLIWAISGGAALDPQVAEFYWEHGVELYQGYGLTEASPVIASNAPGHNRIGTVGRPFPGVEVRIAEDGEILARGPNIMKGYWRKPEATAEAIDPDGWLHTGDVGTIVDGQYLQITDRKKDIFVLAGGKNIAPVAIETALVRNPYIEQAVVYGDKKKFVSALIVPDFYALENWAKQKGIAYASREELVNHPEVYAWMEKQVQEALQGFAPYEQVKRFILLPEAFTFEAGDVTITLKMRRARIIERYRARLDALYES
ncbi:long-chain acyl-CoA synthetase [Armatimonadetes bacterium GBS]|jgi:long-chain acyl-CoA synthetase|nr:Long-chain-fatty-acid--CoA ligase FadD15 [bacterium HR14]GIV13111.1 MAG: AMP-dependent synthetase [Fimbriimonadales bacterium]CUU03978.1 long-chain acyl-CoA synthetase [Armatimonadetes bacterium GBS]CUU38366.1 long-chain acyl-CoA synthetase [Armatimonadetes bacterium GXS]